MLVFAYYFPPLGGAGVQRTVKLLKYLPALGYEPVVVTGPSDASVDWAPPDASFADELPPGTAVHRVPDPRPDPGRLSRRSRRWLGMRDGVGAWWAHAAGIVAREVGQVDLVYATMSPFETARTAGTEARRRGVPWVADLRDPWALDEWTVYPTDLHRRRDALRMGSDLRDAAAVVANTPEAEKAIAGRFPELATRLVVVPNGWDAADFPDPDSQATTHAAGDALRIVYVGYSHTETGDDAGAGGFVRRLARGSTPGLDVGARSHTYLLRAIDLLEQRDPALAGRFEVHLAGASPAGEDEGRVHHHGYLEHAASIALLRSADLLFLPMHDLPVGVRARTVPGKTYEYLASGRPILAALPDGDARDLLDGLPGVRICRPRDVSCIADGIAAAMNQPAAAAVVPRVAARFERRVLAERIAATFDAALQQGPLR